MRNIVLFDDERSFKPGFRDDAIVLRTHVTATEFFETMQETGFVIDELWLDFVLNPGDVTDALRALPGAQVRKVFYHSSATSGFSLVELILRGVGYEGVIEIPETRDAFEPNPRARQTSFI